MAIAPTTTCITNTITLVSGQSFILPPGSKIVGASDVNSIESACADLNNLEQYECFVAIVGTNFMQNIDNEVTYGSRGKSNNNTFIEDYAINNVHIKFPSKMILETGDNNGYFQAANVVSNLETIPGVMAASYNGTDNTSGGRQSYPGISYFVIKTLPSVALNVQLVLTTFVSQTSIQGTNTSFQRFAFKPMENAITEGYIGIPACP